MADLTHDSRRQLTPAMMRRCGLSCYLTYNVLCLKVSHCRNDDIIKIAFYYTKSYWDKWRNLGEFFVQLLLTEMFAKSLSQCGPVVRWFRTHVLSDEALEAAEEAGDGETASYGDGNWWEGGRIENSSRGFRRLRRLTIPGKTLSGPWVKSASEAKYTVERTFDVLWLRPAENATFIIGRNS